MIREGIRGQASKWEPMTALLPLWNPQPATVDWLLDPSRYRAELKQSADAELVLTNGLVSRVFRLGPAFATVGLREERSGTEWLRAVKPEAIVEIAGKRYPIGGLAGQPNRAFLTSDWVTRMSVMPDAFTFRGFEVGKPAKRLDWKPLFGIRAPWPPPGVALTLRFRPPAGLEGIEARIYYELYDGIPVFLKRLELENNGLRTVRIDRFIAENLGLAEAESIVDDSDTWIKPPLTVLTDFSFGGMATRNSNKTVHWVPDPDYKTQVNYNLKTPCDLEVKPPIGPATQLAPSETFRSFHVFTLIHDSTDRERQGLALRKLFRRLAPWSQESPLMLHLTSTDPKVVHTAIDQAADCGFEIVIISFWSGLDMEDQSEANLAKFKGFADYAHAKGLKLGGYSLLASRSVGPETDVIDPKTGKPGGAIFGISPCLVSTWGLEYFRKIKNFLDKTGFDLLEHDGNYPGDVCASTTHAGHEGLDDSQWKQYAVIAELYRWCRGRGIYLNVPDNYFLAGSNKTGMGYRESNWSLPRAQQHLHARQNLFDGTWEKTPSMGWMMVPLVEYQGGGPEATIEPLREHLADYERHLINNLAYGAQACYRGPRLYDAPETRAMVQKWIAWFKKYRKILESDVVHVRRPDGRNLDAIVHVDPGAAIPAMALVWNPTDAERTEELRIPLYFAGLSGTCSIAPEDGGRAYRKLAEGAILPLKVTVPPQGFRWFVIRAGSTSTKAQ